MAFQTTKLTNEWFPYRVEYDNNREPDTKDPLILEIRYVSAIENQKFVDMNLKMNRRRRGIKKGETSRISEKKFFENVKIISGFELDKKPSKDLYWFLRLIPDDLWNEIGEAMGDINLLREGNPENFKPAEAEK